MLCFGKKIVSVGSVIKNVDFLENLGGGPIVRGDMYIDRERVET